MLSKRVFKTSSYCVYKLSSNFSWSVMYWSYSDPSKSVSAFFNWSFKLWTLDWVSSESSPPRAFNCFLMSVIDLTCSSISLEYWYKSFSFCKKSLRLSISFWRISSILLYDSSTKSWIDFFSPLAFWIISLCCLIYSLRLSINLVLDGSFSISAFNSATFSLYLSASAI